MRILWKLVPLLGLAAGCHFGDAPSPDRGFALSWKLVDVTAPDPQTAPALSCPQAGISTVLLDALDHQSTERHRVEFSCETLEGITPALPTSRYQVLLSARTKDGTPRSEIKFEADNYNDYSSDLGLTIFTVQLPR